MTPEQALEAAREILGGNSAIARIVSAARPDRACTPQAVAQWRRCPRDRVKPVADALRQAKGCRFPTEHDLDPEDFPKVRKTPKTKGE